MNIALESTTVLVDIETADGRVVPVRVWKGITQGGIPIEAFIFSVAVNNEEDAKRFEVEKPEYMKRTIDTYSLAKDTGQ